jgi:predicted Zn-dependent protease
MPGSEQRRTLTALGLLALTGGLVVALIVVLNRSGPAGGSGGGGTPPGQAGVTPQRTVQPTDEQLAAVLDSAKKLVSEQEIAKAQAVLEGAIRQYPETQDLYLALAQVLVNANDLEGAYAQFERALAVGPITAPVQYGAGTLALTLGKVDRAEEHFSAAQTADPRDPDYPQSLAQVYTRRNQLPEASAALLRAANLDPGRAKVWANLAELELRQNRPSTGHQYILKARELEPRTAAWRLIEARALNRLGKAEQAANLLAGLDPESRHQLPVLRLLAESYGLLKRPDLAADAYAQASDAVPTDPQLAYEAATAADRAARPGEARRLAVRAESLGHAEARELADRLANAPE